MLPQSTNLTLVGKRALVKADVVHSSLILFVLLQIEQLQVNFLLFQFYMWNLTAKCSEMKLSP